MRMKDEDWDAVLEVNMTASMSLCRAAMRGMMKAKTGRIIYFISCWRDRQSWTNKLCGLKSWDDWL